MINYTDFHSLPSGSGFRRWFYTSPKTGRTWSSVLYASECEPLYDGEDSKKKNLETLKAKIKQGRVFKSYNEAYNNY